MRTNEGKKSSHESAALVHLVVADELDTVAARADSGEQIRRNGGERKREKCAR